MREVEDYAVEILALGFVDGQEPSEAKGGLFEAANYVLCEPAVCVIGLEDLSGIGFKWTFFAS